MLNFWKIIRAILIRSLEITVIVVVSALVIDVIWQVAAGFLADWRIIDKPPRWTEELATILLIWVSLLGASVGFIRKTHLGVDYFVCKLKGKLKIIIEFLVYVLIIAFAGIILISFSLLRMLREKRNAPVKRQLVAVILRLVVISVLVAIFLNPIIISPKDEEGKQKLIVLLDRSASMATQDVENTSRFEAALSTLQDPEILEALKS